MNQKSVSIVIATYNGKELLAKFLSSVVEAVKFYKGQKEIIIVDDGGYDGSDEFIKSNFPEIILLKLEKNIGPLLAINEGFKVAKNQIVILLDNDVLVANDFVYPLVTHFDDEGVFGVGPGLELLEVKSRENKSEAFLRGLVVKRGFIEISAIKIGKTDKHNITFILSGAAAAMDREKLLKLGGFDELLNPFYWEDVDLSYRAWKRGWKILYEPKSLVYHQVHASIFKEYKKHYIDKISERNRYIFFWKNILDKKLLLYHLSWIPLRLLWFLLIGKWWRISSFFLAVLQFKTIRAKRKVELQEAKMSDFDLFNLFYRISQ